MNQHYKKIYTQSDFAELCVVDALFHRVLFCCYVHSAGFQAHLVWPQLSQSVQSVPESSEYVQPHVSIPVAAFDGGTSDTPVLFSLIVFFYFVFFGGGGH